LILRDLNGRFGQERSEYENQIRNLRQKMMELENKIALLSGELDRLSNENEQWKAKSVAQEQQRIRDMEIQKKQLEQAAQIRLEQELSQASIRFATEKQQLEAKNKDTRQKIIDAENKLTYMAVEIERLNTLYEETKKELEVWK
jgi:hypothetical protein